MIGAACGAGLFAAGVVTADSLGPGPAATNAALAGPGVTIREAARLRSELAAEDERPLLAGGAALARVARVAAPSVVHIESRYKDPDGGGGVEETGSGVIAGHPTVPGTYVLTNRHVVAGGGTEGVFLQLSDGRTVQPRRIWTDRETDLAVLEIEPVDLPSIRFGDSDALEPGHFVMALGSPFGLSRSVSLGIISAKGRRRLDLGTEDLINQDFLQTDAAINPGNSGGPLVDLNGRLIGINTAIASSSGGSEGIGFSIPSALVRRVFDELLTHGRVRRGYLGVQLDSRFADADARKVGLDRLYGARVQFVKPATPAHDAGLRVNDVVLRFGATEVQDTDHLINLVSLTEVGERVTLTVLRDGRRVDLSLNLTERPVSRVTARKSPR